MQTPEDRACHYLDRIIELASKNFPYAVIEWDRRPASYENGKEVIEVRVFDTGGSNPRPFVPFAVICMTNPADPLFRVKTRHWQGADGLLEKNYAPESLLEGLRVQIGQAFVGNFTDRWRYLEAGDLGALSSPN